jgi:hypothetical protein
MHPVELYVEDMSRLAIQKIDGQAKSVEEVKQVVGLLCLEETPQIHDRVVNRVLESSIKSNGIPSNTENLINSAIAVAVFAGGIVPLLISLI